MMHSVFIPLALFRDSVHICPSVVRCVKLNVPYLPKDCVLSENDNFEYSIQEILQTNNVTNKLPVIDIPMAEFKFGLHSDNLHLSVFVDGVRQCEMFQLLFPYFRRKATFKLNKLNNVLLIRDTGEFEFLSKFSDSLISSLRQYSFIQESDQNMVGLRLGNAALYYKNKAKSINLRCDMCSAISYSSAAGKSGWLRIPDTMVRNRMLMPGCFSGVTDAFVAYCIALPPTQLVNMDLGTYGVCSLQADVPKITSILNVTSILHELYTAIAAAIFSSSVVSARLCIAENTLRALVLNDFVITRIKLSASLHCPINLVNYYKHSCTLAVELENNAFVESINVLTVRGSTSGVELVCRGSMDKLPEVSLAYYNHLDANNQPVIEGSYAAYVAYNIEEYRNFVIPYCLSFATSKLVAHNFVYIYIDTFLDKQVVSIKLDELVDAYGIIFVIKNDAVDNERSISLTAQYLSLHSPKAAGYYLYFGTGMPTPEQCIFIPWASNTTSATATHNYKSGQIFQQCGDAVQLHGKLNVHIAVYNIEYFENK